MRRIASGIGVCLSTLLLGCGGSTQDTSSQGVASGDAAALQTDTPDGLESADWLVLFDGTNLDHWRGYRRDDVPAGWRIEDGTLAFVPGGNGGDLITREQFGSFELELEWRVSPGGNSGIFFHGTEDHDHIWQSAPEVQVLDNAGHADGADPRTSAGSNYALHGPAEDVTRPVGEWNEVRLVVRGDDVEHWLNGTRVVAYRLGSPEWQELVAASKFNEMPAYGQARVGHIGLQDHGDRVWYRNIRIRSLDGGS